MNGLWAVWLACVKPVDLGALEPSSGASLGAMRGPVAALPAPGQRVDRVMFGSCAQQEEPMPILRHVQPGETDIFVMLGDNVYGDDKRGDGRLEGLRAAYAALAVQPDFRAVSSAVPILPTWDDHDFGKNDAGAEFEYRSYSEALFESFWGVESPDPRATRAGVYGGWVFGPEGERLQLLLLDTRFFRSELRSKRRWSLRKGRYRESQSESQDMLGDEQWAWLEAQLARPADLRVIVSSVQVLATNHGWERWGQLPAERDRLLALLHAHPNTVIVSGDRHWASVYRDETGLTELTTSAINRPAKHRIREAGIHQITLPFTEVNLGALEIDWPNKTAHLILLDENGVSQADIAVQIRDQSDESMGSEGSQMMVPLHMPPGNDDDGPGSQRSPQ